MLEATVHDGPQELGFEQEVPEAGAVDGHVGTLYFLLHGLGGALWRSLRLLVFLVVQQLMIAVIVSHAGETQTHGEVRRDSHTGHTPYLVNICPDSRDLDI